MKPDEALSDVRRKSVNDWYDSTLSSRLTHKQTGCIILIMQRLHQDDLTAHVQQHEPWKVVSLSAIAQADETHTVRCPVGTAVFTRNEGEALHPEREPLEALERQRNVMTQPYFAAQYLQSPTPPGGLIIKADWLLPYEDYEVREQFDETVLSLDTAVKVSDLSDYTVATFWGIKNKHFYLLDVVRRRMEFPELAQTVRRLISQHNPGTVLIKDKSSGSQLIQQLLSEGCHRVKGYIPNGNDKTMRTIGHTTTFSNGFVHVPKYAPFLTDYIREMTAFPSAKYDDQVDSTIQVLDWYENDGGDSVAEYIAAINRSHMFR